MEFGSDLESRKGARADDMEVLEASGLSALTRLTKSCHESPETLAPKVPHDINDNHPKLPFPFVRRVSYCTCIPTEGVVVYSLISSNAEMSGEKTGWPRFL